VSDRGKLYEYINQVQIQRYYRYYTKVLPSNKFIWLAFRAQSTHE